MPSNLHELTLTAAAYGGEALGRLDDGRAVFVPFAMAGERVRVQLVEERGRFARGKVVELLNASPERIAPRCKHFGVCGGCHYQHMPYEQQLATKAEILRDQLARIGHIQNPPVEPAVASEPWNYRNQVQFHLTAAGKVGYVRAEAGRAETGRVLAIEECHLPEAPINTLWPQLEFEVEAGIDRVSIRAGIDDDLLMTLETETAGAPEVETQADISVAHLFGGNAAVLQGRDYVMMRVLERDFRVSAASFFQVNTQMAGKMVQHVLASLPAALTTLLDVYCGAGLFSAFLASRCDRLIGVESEAAACEDFAINLDEFENVELYEDAAERALPALDLKPEAVLLDPPRAGVEREALEAVVRMSPRRIVYVSCDPSTLARDAERLIHNGYRLGNVTPFDLFPQTYHIESISLFDR